MLRIPRRREEKYVRVTNIETRQVESGFPLTFSDGTYQLTKRSSVLCRISTDEGVTGEVCVGNEDSYSARFFELIHGPFREILVGRDPLMIEEHWEKMIAHATKAPEPDAVIKAISTVDVTLWDLKGKVCGLPVYKLIGGRTDRVPIIGIGGYYETCSDEQGIRDEITFYKDIGLAGIKFKVGRFDVQEDVERVRVARDAAGDDFAIVVDSNLAWVPAEAVRFAMQIRDCNPCWLEEPVHWRNIPRGLREVRQKSGVPVGAGQSELSVFGCYELLAREAVDVINVTANRGGGITAWLKIAGAAALADVTMGHVAEPHIAMHLMAGISNPTFVECYPDVRRDPFWDELYENRPAIVDGYITLPDRPGHGLTFNRHAVERFALGPWQ